MYKLFNGPNGQLADAVLRVEDGAFIPFDPANIDYQRFKTEIEAGEAELQDREGVTMSPEEAKAFVATLP